ncbi:uncharacterized protein LOC122300136 [Carya illinoinensis]|uniref:uncharacterized protein LOC122300136 n=1 Tax=Carya illinoinensis TaxID=32201 RepID=UPI001C728F23|nr:uncharacterized protein LOC122300136 [Carya illinoinensis]
MCSRNLQKRSISNQTFKELLASLMDEVDGEVLIEMAVVVWRLWKRRNEWIFQEIFTNPTSILKQVNQKLQELKVLYNNPSNTSERQEGREGIVEFWKPPPNNFYKINWDAAVDHKKCRVGVGVIVRNWEGQVMGTMRTNNSLFPDPHLAEAYGALQAVSLGTELGLRKIILEGDALNVVKEINGELEN